VNNLEAALAYSEKGFSVIPIRPDKQPFIQWKEFQKRRATKEEIKKWVSQWPGAMIGIVTGEISGVFVVDCDSQEAYEKIQAMLPECFLTAIVKTPRGYHIYLLYPADRQIGNATGIMPGVDVRGEGGYIIAPPSVNAEGKVYEWLLSIFEVGAAPMPDAIYNIINNNSIPYRGGCGQDNNPKTTKTTNDHKDHKMFENGRRDNDLFHTANCLVKGGMPEVEISQVLENLIVSWGETPDRKWIEAKIISASKRDDARERNLAAEIREWVETTKGHFQTTDCHKELQLTTKTTMKAANMALLRLCESPNPILERYGDRRGCYRKIENDIEAVDFLNAPTDEFPLRLPMGIDSFTMLYPGNIVVVAGSKSAGKTAFLLNIVKQNMQQHEIAYLNSEMGDTEFRKRLELFGDPLESWQFKAFHRASGFSDLITPEKKIFIIDFLEVTTDFWKVAAYIQEVHKKLKDGIAIIALQKSYNKETGRGGDFSKEKARLYLSLDYLPEQKANVVKIVDAKAWRTHRNPRGLCRRYKLSNGAVFMPVGDWYE